MADTLFVRASDVAKEMGVSEAMVIRLLENLIMNLKSRGL